MNKEVKSAGSIEVIHPEPRMVYMISKGEYSDYHHIAAFSNKEEAEEYVAQYGDDARVEEWELDKIRMSDVRGKKYWQILMDQAGNTHRSTLLSGIGETVARFVGISQGFNDGNPSPWSLSLECMALDKDHAIKIANEKRTLALAADLWPAPATTWEYLPAYKNGTWVKNEKVKP